MDRSQLEDEIRSNINELLDGLVDDDAAVPLTPVAATDEVRAMVGKILNDWLGIGT